MGSSLGVLLLSWGLFLDTDRAFLWWKTLLHHIIFGLSTPIPIGFFEVLLLSILLLLCEPRVLAIGLGEWLGNTRLARLWSVVPPFLGLPFLPCVFGASVVPTICGRAHPGR